MLPKRQSREVAAANVEQLANAASAARKQTHSAAFGRFAMEAAALKSISSRVRAAVKVPPAYPLPPCHVPRLLFGPWLSAVHATYAHSHSRSLCTCTPLYTHLAWLECWAV